MKPEPFAIFFPPRILFPDFEVGTHNEVLDEAAERYINMGLCLVDEVHLKEAQSICEFARQFPDTALGPPSTSPPPSSAIPSV